MNVRLNKNQKIKILNSDDIFKILKQVLLRENKIRRSQEHFWVIGLDDSNKILFIELLGLGARNRVSIEPPLVFRLAVQKLSYKIILAHNHPSGNLTPSKADVDFTDKIFKVGSILEIDVLDHLIITETDYQSFENEGILDRIKDSGMYEVLNRDKVGIIEWKLELEKKQAKKDASIAIAKKMKKDGADEKYIKKMTGLYLDEIRKL